MRWNDTARAVVVTVARRCARMLGDSVFRSAARDVHRSPPACPPASTSRVARRPRPSFASSAITSARFTPRLRSASRRRTGTGARWWANRKHRRRHATSLRRLPRATTQPSDSSAIFRSSGRERLGGCTVNDRDRSSTQRPSICFAQDLCPTVLREQLQFAALSPADISLCCGTVPIICRRGFPDSDAPRRHRVDKS